MKAHREIEINAPADEAWKVLGEGFGTIGEWACGITTSSLEGGLKVGGTRTCESPGFWPLKAGIVQERLVAYDPSSMTFEYEAISGLPGFMRKAGNRWSIHKVDEQNCIVRFHGTMELRGIMKLLGPFMMLMMRAGLNRFVDELRHRVANGRPHPRKLEILNKK